MFHEDGIEVYLKPAGDENDRVKFAEFALPESQTIDDDKRHRRCAVVARHGDLNVVVRLSPDFKMYAASALLIKYHLDSMAAKSWNGVVIQRSQAHEQIEKRQFGVSDLKASKTPSRVQAMSMTKAGDALRGDFDENGVQPIRDKKRFVPPGSIIVHVCRGTVNWQDDQSSESQRANRLYGPKDPSEFRKRDNQSARCIAGEKGKWYSFEFRYRSEDYIRSRHEAFGPSNGNDWGSSFSTDKIAIIEDKEFPQFREEDELEREVASEAFKRRQAALADGGDVEIAKSTQKKSASVASKKSSSSSQRNQPQFCNCPDPSHNRATEAPRAKGGKGLRQARPRVPKSNISTVPEATPRATSNAEKDSQPAENNPPVCAKCSGLKVANSRRPAFLRKWYGENSQPRDEDTDDEEELPPPPAEQPKEPNGEDSSEVGRVDKTAAEGGAKNSETPASVPSGDEASQEEAHEPAVVAEETTAAEDSEEVIAKPGNDAATDNPDAAAPIATGATVSTADDDGKAASAEGVAAENSDAPVEKAVDDAQATPNEQPPLAGATPSRKRTSEPAAEKRPAKQQRIDIDLTVEDPVTIKKEGSQEDSQSPEMLNTEDTEDREELQAQLLDIKMQREELQLRRKEAKVERKLRELARKERSKSSRRTTDFIKIED